MYIEDVLSFTYREAMKEEERRLDECNKMFIEEMRQTKIDSFWGIPTEERRRWLEEERRRLQREVIIMKQHDVFVFFIQLYCCWYFIL